MSMKNYDPKNISVVVGIHAVGGISDGTFVTVEMDEDAFSKKVGADGEVTRSKSNNYSGKITITLQQASASNDFFSSLAILDRASGAGVVPITLRDANGTTICFAESGWAQKFANVEFGPESGDREWVFDCASIEMFIGGHSS
jgi:hypothetical protein